jgi:hypothetical protein
MKPGSHEIGLPGRRRYAIAALLLTLAVVGVPAGVAWLVLSQPSPTQFLAPGPYDFTAAQTGKYVLWHEYDTIFAGVTYSSNTLPSGLTITCRNAISGTNLTVRADRGSTMSTLNLRRESVAAVDIPATGRYLVGVEGATQPILFSFGPAILGKSLGTILGALPVAFALFVGGVALIANTHIRRSRALRNLHSENAAPAQGFNR